jgi:hypothetical protein
VQVAGNQAERFARLRRAEAVRAGVVGRIVTGPRVDLRGCRVDPNREVLIQRRMPGRQGVVQRVRAERTRCGVAGA